MRTRDPIQQLQDRLNATIRATLAEKDKEISRLNHVVAGLQARLRLLDSDPGENVPAWAADARPQVRDLMALLVLRHPRVLSILVLQEALTPYDHARDDAPNTARQVVYYARKHFGKDAIFTVPGVGYRAGDAFVKQVTR